jgi:hypothetical protein
MSLEKFKIEIASPPDREKLVAMVSFENDQWAELNLEFEKMILEIYPRKDGKPWVFDFATALKVLHEAEQRLSVHYQ